MKMHESLFVALVLIGGLTFGLASVSPCSAVASTDFSKAVIVTASDASPVELKAAQMLKEEVEKRTRIALRIVTQLPDAGPAIVLAGRARMTGLESLALPAAPLGKDAQPAAEGYVLAVGAASRKDPTLLAIGNDERGALFAAGRLLRAAELREEKILVASGLNISAAPRMPVRGHQLGYRPKSNSYDAWDAARFEQYVRDLIVFGTNAIELLTPLDPDDAVCGPLMPISPEQMQVELSRMVASYGLDVWLWLPGPRRDITDPEYRKRTLDERERLFALLPRVDQVMVPSGDPGDTPPDLLLPWMAELAVVLRKHHPKAGLWVSNQGFEPEERDYFYRYLNEKKPDWLTGVTYGPWSRDTIDGMRRAVPAQFPVRDYPDVTHCIRCQYPVPEWDAAFALTLGREPIMPRPTQYAHILRLNAPSASCGFVTYSDGVNDDVNKMIWGAVGWDPDADVRQLLVDYGNHFVGPDFAQQVADGLLGLEKNWVGPAITNQGVDKTLALWQQMEQRAPAETLANWRFQQGLYRAYYDAYARKRLIHETKAEKEALGWLARAPSVGAEMAIRAARDEMDRAKAAPVAPELRARIEELAGALFKSIGMQLSVPKYGASATERGANLDAIDTPLSNMPWIQAELDRLAGQSEAAKLAGIQRIVRWEDAGPGGFYDDLGNGAREPHLVREPSWAQDPGYVNGPQDEYGGPRAPARISWQHQAQALYDAPLRLRYEGLDPAAQYVLRATYCGRFNCVMKLVADGKFVIHEDAGPQNPIAPVEFDIPKEATADGTLELTWTRVTGRGPQVAEAWLIKQ